MPGSPVVPARRCAVPVAAVWDIPIFSYQENEMRFKHVRTLIRPDGTRRCPSPLQSVLDRCTFLRERAAGRQSDPYELELDPDLYPHFLLRLLLSLFLPHKKAPITCDDREVLCTNSALPKATVVPWPLRRLPYSSLGRCSPCLDQLASRLFE